MESHYVSRYTQNAGQRRSGTKVGETIQTVQATNAVFVVDVAGISGDFTIADAHT